MFLEELLFDELTSEQAILIKEKNISNNANNILELCKIFS